MKAEDFCTVFRKATADYHVHDHVDTVMQSPYPSDSLEDILYHKNWIDTVQWHLEDIIRDPLIDPLQALTIKRRIDASNQERTDMVEKLDTHFREMFKDVSPLPNATINTESPAWAIDRLSILILKIYHMNEQTQRTDISEHHIKMCQSKLNILLEQQEDLITSINQLLEDIANGRKYMKVYRQMKMYNDPTLNPVLYKQAEPHDSHSL